MCGRAYSTYTEEELEIRYHSKKPIKLPRFGPNYNLSPTQDAVVVRADEDSKDKQKIFELSRWGLVPVWAKTIQDASKYSLINAKGEEIETKRSYQAAFKRRRCLVPLSGFIEWKREESGSKRPFKIFLKDGSIMSLAGVWESWKNPEGKDLHSFSIITTRANSFMQKIHDRMPVILDPKDEDHWLDPELQDTQELKSLLKSCPSKWLASQEISTLINSPRNNRVEVLEPLKN